jgi:OOP family OmpA-OmpF porin
MLPWGLACALFAGLAPQPAAAQNRGFQVGRYEPTAAGEWSFWVDHPWYNRPKVVSAGLTLDYGHNPLVYNLVRADGSIAQTQSIISHSLVGHLDLAFAIRNRLLLTASLPVSFLESGETVSGSGITPAAGAYVSDPRLGAMVRLYGQPYSSGFSASLGGQVWLPLRAITDSLPDQASDQSVRGMLKLILGGYKSHILWSANLGVLLRPLAQIGDVMSPYGRTAGHEIQAGVAVAYADTHRRFAVGPEAVFAASLSDRAFQPTTSSLEVLLGANYNIAKTIQLGLAGGAGVWRQAGTPDARVLFRLAYAPIGKGHAAKPSRDGDAPKVKDQDRDGIPDANDLCPGEPQGLRPDPQQPGCPLRDRDGDGVKDAEDLCPDQSGGENPDPARRGCPAPVAGPSDRDGDGFADAEDQCPDEKAGATPDPARRGCPTPVVSDRDADGIPDGEDACPDQKPGSLPDPARKGCPIPDRDGDGIQDAEDQCPDNAQGAVADPSRRGCPANDKDGDGVYDHEDQCPYRASGGLPDPGRRGCPLDDQDHDLVPDREDACPDKAGAPDRNPKRNGCPNPFVIIENGRVVLKQAIAFKVSSDEILPQSNLILTATANVLRDASMVKKLRIEAHTDNVGTPDGNMTLSQQRAEAIMRRLTEQGIDASRLEAQGFGDTRPLDDNRTPAGRAKNRRIDFVIVDPVQ